MSNLNFIKKSNFSWLVNQENWVTVLIGEPSYFKDLVVPENLKKLSPLVLDIGYNTMPPVLDLEIEEKGIFCTLAFDGKLTKCYLPWESISAFIFDNGLSNVSFSYNLPLQVSEEKEVEKKPNGFLKLVD